MLLRISLLNFKFSITFSTFKKRIIEALEKELVWNIKKETRRITEGTFKRNIKIQLHLVKNQANAMRSSKLHKNPYLYFTLHQFIAIWHRLTLNSDTLSNKSVFSFIYILILQAIFLRLSLWKKKLEKFCHEKGFCWNVEYIWGQYNIINKLQKRT